MKHIYRICVSCLVAIVFITAAIPLETHPSGERTTEQSQQTNLAGSGYDGSTLYVGGNGPDNYTTIQAAVDAASDGDTVFVYDDSSPYYENVDIDTSIHFVGENRNTTIIDGQRNWAVVNITADNVTLQDFTIQNGKFSGIHLLSDGNVITSALLRDNGWEALYVDHSHHNRILGNTIISNDDWALDIESSHNTTIAHNIIDSNGRGISLMRANHTTITNNHIANHTIEGIILWSGHNNHISTNSFSDNTVGIYLLASHNVITSNSFYHNGLTTYAPANTVTDNTVNGKPLVYLEGYSDMTIDGQAGQIILVNSSNITIQHHNVSHASTGIELLNTDNCLISDNIIDANEEGIFLTNAHHNQIQQNTGWGDHEGIVLRNSHNNDIDGNTLRDLTYTGINVQGSNRNTVTENYINGSQTGMLIGGEINKARNNTILQCTEEGILMTSSDLNILQGNTVGHSNYGIFITGKYKGSLLNLLGDNLVHNNTCGMFIQNGYGNLFCNNWFMDNDEHVSVNHPDRLILNLWCMNHWDTVSGPIDGIKKVFCEDKNNE